MYTTKEAAEILGVSTRRVNALIQSGDLHAQKFGRAWMVDDRAVRNRMKQSHPAGRPKLGEKDPRNLVELTLMNRNHAVIDFVYSRRTHTVGDVSPREGIAWRPLGIGMLGRTPNRYDVEAWLKARAIPDLRPNLASVLRALGLTGASDLMLESWGLNLSDQYWLKPADAQVNWHDINFFENGYEETLGPTLLAGAPIERISHSPDAATSGMLAKTWVRRNGTDYLIKAGIGNENREPYCEVLATRLLTRLLNEGEYVPYHLESSNGRTYSACPCMVDAETELIPAADVLVAFGVTEGRDLYQGYRSALDELGVTDGVRMMSKMIVADYLMANFDRHTHNFGLIRHAERLDGYRVAPLFDNGCGFYSRATTAELAQGRYLWESHPFRPYPSQQLALVEDISWYDPACLDGFLEEIAEVFGGNPALDAEFIAAAQRQTAKQIETVNDLARERRAFFPAGR